jgi:hypothetical protein
MISEKNYIRPAGYANRWIADWGASPDTIAISPPVAPDISSG